MKIWSNRVRSLMVAVATAAIVACSENLSGGMACPALCPNPPGTMVEVTIPAVQLDTSIAGYPTLGTELQFYVATLGDTLESAAAIRFDSLPRVFRRLNSAEDSLITQIDTGSYLRLAIATGDTTGPPTTVEVYDIDLNGAEDNDPGLVATAFTPERLIATRTVPADSLRDSIRVPIDPAFILLKIQDTFPSNRLRLGVRVSQAGNTQLTVLSTNSGGAATLVFRPSLDTALTVLHNEPFSRAPNDPFLASDMADYLVVLKEPPPPPAGAFRVGGLPARRVYLRFHIPPVILDSSDVVRATLFLDQRPNAFAPEAADTVGIGHFGVVASSTVTDLTRALFFLQRLNNRDTLNVVPSDSGLRAFEIIDWVRAWRLTDSLKTPRAIGLATTEEGKNGRMIDFFSIEAPPDVRPRLRLTYIPRPVGRLP